MSKEKLKIDFGKKQLKATLNAYGFQDGEFYVLYIPSLEISAYGDDLKDAMNMLDESLHLFSEDLLNLPEGKAKEHLKKLGWKVDKFFKKKMEQSKELSPDLLKKEYDLPTNIDIQQIPIAI